jgi:hypothetical protein
MKSGKYFMLIILFAAVSCDTGEKDSFAIFSQSYDFNLSTWGWEAGFSDYPANSDSDSDTLYNWNAAYSAAPSIDGKQMALRLSCEDDNGGIFMYIKKQVSGLHPNTTYSIVYTIDVYSEVGNSDSTVLKAGASFIEPQNVVRNGWFELNLDKGEIYQSGTDLFVMGQLHTPFDGSGYLYTSFNNATAPRRFTAKTNNLGEMWLIVGTESRPGINTIYYSQIHVVFSSS